MKAHRPTIMGTRHMVAATQYLAAEAGFRILEAGGNAIDAGVAAGISLGVVQPEFVNVAGVAPIIIYSAAEKRLVTIPGLGTWPKAIERDYFKKNHGGKIPQGIMRTVVPAAPDAWITALERFGTMSFGEVAQSAISYARDGFPVYPLMSEIITDHEAEYRAFPSNVALYLPKGRPPQARRSLRAEGARQPRLQHMVDQEAAARSRGREAGLAAARDAFYRGDIARAIVKYQKENGGILSAEDLRELSLGLRRAGRDIVRRHQALRLRPVVPGAVAVAGDQPLDAAELHKLGHNSIGYLHRITEAVKLAFADREAYFGDPRMVDVPIEALLSRDYARQRREMIRPDRAWPEMPPAGDPRKLAAERSTRGARAGAGARLLGAGARHLARLRHRPARQRVRGDAERRLLQRAGDSGARHHSLAARQPELGRPGSSVRRRARQAAAAHAQPGDRDPARQDEDAVRHARRRRADAGDAAGVPQHPSVRHGGAGGGRGAARRVLQLSRPRSSRTPIIRACSIWRAGSTRRPARRSVKPRPQGRMVAGLDLARRRRLHGRRRRGDRRTQGRRRPAPAVLCARVVSPRFQDDVR